MKRLMLSRGKFALVDDEDFKQLSKWKWSFSPPGYAVRREKGQKIFLHRFILKTPKGIVVDHKNNDGLDNRRRNIRNCSYSENSHNSKGHRDSISGLKGVKFEKEQVNKKWRA